MYDKVELLASSAKIAIELLPMKEDTKEWSKMGVEVTATTYKLYQEAKKEHIQEQAKRHNLDRVISFTCTIDGKQQTALRLYGGDMSAFCQALDLTLYLEGNSSEVSAYIDQMVRQNGTVIYERK